MLFFRKMTERTTRRGLFRRLREIEGVEKGGEGDERTATVDGAGSKMANLSYLLFAWTSRIRMYKFAQAGSQRHTYILLVEKQRMYVYNEIVYTRAHRQRTNERVCVNTYTLCVYTKQAATSNSKASFKALSLFLLQRL